MSESGLRYGSGRPVIGIFGHYGNENLGDEAIIEALIARIRAERPDADIRCFSIHPRDSSLRYGVTAYPIRISGESELAPPARAPEAGARSPEAPPSEGHEARRAARPLVSRVKTLIPEKPRAVLAAVARLPGLAREAADEIRFLIRSYRRLRHVDALIIAGSNQFLDNFGGPWGFPYTLFKWSLLARLARCRLLYVSVGAGPLDSRISRLLVRGAIRFAHYLSFRDAASQRLIEGARSRRSNGVYPDLAHSLVLPASVAAPLASRAGGGKPVVGINPMPLYDQRYWCATDQGRYQSYVSTLATFAEHLVDHGYPVFLFPTQPKDVNVALDIVRTMRPAAAARLAQPDPVRRPRTVDDLMNAICCADIVVATRFHGTLLSLHARRPVVAICYYRKTRDLMREMGQHGYAIDFDDLDVTNLIDRFHQLEQNRIEAEAQITRTNDLFLRALDSQYRAIFPIMLKRTDGGLPPPRSRPGDGFPGPV